MAVNHTMDRSFLDASIPALVRSLTIEEKVQLLAAKDWWHTYPIPRLNIPSVKVTDGPAGARGGSSYDMMAPATSFPNATCLAATFSLPLAESMGAILAEETKARGAQCLLAPTINIQRSPIGGRAFESFSEDPTLSGHIAAAYINGLQGAGISATIKHFICNDQEHERNGQDSIVSQRALREVYLRPFQIAQALSKPWAYMTSYNKINGTHAAENPWLLQELLRKEWGHEGLIMSDWYGTYSVSEGINAGLNVEFPGPTIWRGWPQVSHLLKSHKLEERTIDKVITETLKWAQKLAKLNPDQVYAQDRKEKTRWNEKEKDQKVVHRIITEGMVLLKNEGDILPVKKGKVAIIGPNAKARVFTGGGSARLQPSWSSSPWEGFTDRKPSGVDLSFAQGTTTAKFLPMLDDNFTAEDGSVGFDAYHYPIGPDGKQGKECLVRDKLVRSEVRMNDFHGREIVGEHYFTDLKCTFTSPITGEYEFGFSVTGKAWFWVDDKLVCDISEYTAKTTNGAFYGNGTDEEIVKVKVEQGKKYQLRLLHDTREPPNVTRDQMSPLNYFGIRWGAQPAYDPSTAMDEAVSVAASSDVAIVVCGLNADWETEGADRPDMRMPLATDELIAKVAAANPNTIVVIQAGSAVSMPWLDQVRGVVQAWYGGAETGTGMADVVYGNVNPSGRLPISFPVREEDIAANLNFKSARTKTYYEEGIWVGYKHFNARKIAPLFPFGHGLSYTSFEYGNLKIKVSGSKPEDWKLEATATVKNVGKEKGSHSVHFYACPPPETATGLLHPEASLQAWDKVYDLAPGESKEVNVSMDKYAISHWDEGWKTWRAEPGKWTIKIGKTASELEGEATFEVEGPFEWTGL